MMRRALIAVAVLVAIASVRPADAYWGCGGYGVNYYGYGLPAGWYTGVNDRVPPYFALHPPVYYSGQIVRIPYGASPFAYPWGTPFGVRSAAAAPLVTAAPAPENEAAEPVMITNEHYNPMQGKLPAPKANGRRSAERQGRIESGLMIENPFYKSAPRLASGKQR
jgi:hypothetical protein